MQLNQQMLAVGPRAPSALPAPAPAPAVLSFSAAMRETAVVRSSRPPRRSPVVLSFPEPGLDDPAAYQGYRTRFWRDAAGNAVQVYVDAHSGRVVLLWADAANESLGFTARDTAGHPVALAWGADEALVSAGGRSRTVELRLKLGQAPLDLGFFLLGSMRIERDFQYASAQLRPFGSDTLIPRELPRLIAALERLEPAERARELALLHARSTAELRARLAPSLARLPGGDIRVQQASLDGRDTLRLNLSVPAGSGSLEFSGGIVRLRARQGARDIPLTLTASTTAAALTPLTRAEIFRPDFLAFYARARSARDSAAAAGAPPTDARIMHFRWLDRELRGVELVSYREKLMAGLPNFATYFGRDDMLTALLMRPIWKPALSEAVIGAVLRKLAPDGQVSHEEALGGQAIREHAVVYGRPALAVPVAEVRATATVTELPEESVKVHIRRSTIRAAAWQENIHLEAPEIGLASTLCELESKEDPHPLAFAVTTLLDALEVENLPPLSIRIDSTIPVAAGLGSGAAVTVAILRALLAFLGRSLPNRRNIS